MKRPTVKQILNEIQNRGRDGNRKIRQVKVVNGEWQWVASARRKGATCR